MRSFIVAVAAQVLAANRALLEQWLNNTYFEFGDHSANSELDTQRFTGR